MATAALSRPAHAAVRIAEDGTPGIEGYRCAACGATMLDQPLACRSCGDRTPPAPFRAAEAGRVVTWSLVLRSFPGVAVPFVSAIVDLDGGPTLKATIRDVDPDALHVGMPVALVFDDAGGARDKDDGSYIGFHFVPAGASA